MKVLKEGKRVVLTITCAGLGEMTGLGFVKKFTGLGGSYLNKVSVYLHPKTYTSPH